MLDTISKTLTLPDHRAERLHEILNSIHPTQRSIATKAWHKIVGELRSMSIALPGCSGLFSILQEAFRHEDATASVSDLQKRSTVFWMIFAGLHTTSARD